MQQIAAIRLNEVKKDLYHLEKKNNAVPIIMQIMEENKEN